MNTAKKAYIMQQHLLLSEKKRKEAKKHAKRNILQIPKRATHKNDK